MSLHQQRIAHAMAAVHQADAMVAMARAGCGQTGISHDHRLALQVALHDLGKHRERLASALEQLISSPGDQAATRWVLFLDAYNAFCEASRGWRRTNIEFERGEVPEPIESAATIRLSINA